MKSYRVVWEIDIDAANPREAAEEAFHHMQRQGTTTTVFDVVDEDGESVRVDLLSEEEEEELEESDVR